MIEKDLFFILEKAIKAPSADNLQPWKFRRVSEDAVELWLDAKKLDSYCDAGLAAPYISAGAVIENMRVAATKTGRGAACYYFPDPDEPFLVARVALRPDFASEHAHFACLDKRHTNRRFYDTDKPLSPAILQALEKTVPGGGFRLLFKTRQDADFSALASLTGEADQLRFEVKRLHRELMNVMRFDSASAAGSRDGLSIPSLDAGPAASLVFPLIRDWNRLQFLNKLGMSYSFNLFAKMQMLSSQAAALLVSPGKSAKNYVAGGEILQRVWHEATRLGLAFQPMEALPIFIINQELTGGQDLSRAQNKKLEALKESFLKIFGVDPDSGLIMFFRVGFAPDPSALSLRRPLESFWMDAPEHAHEKLAG
ncbi:MAG TPA: hypothetical protein VL688_08125 [Verrucomicrobiae bacterium]|nr:hypothetical protein [Verrucomicrobiae bacterium]